jgi:hypothetical protein
MRRSAPPVRGRTAILLGALLFANAATALELEELQQEIGHELALRIEHRGTRLAAELGRNSLRQPLLWTAASMRCVDYTPGAAECRVVLAEATRAARAASPSASE